VLAPTLPDREGHLVLLALDELDVHVYVSDIFRELSARTLDVDLSGLDA